jgi:hypothetical protein
MNERTKEIASQVLDELVPETWTALGYDKIKEIQFRTAELIVRECANVGLETHGNYDVHDDILKHFGVEE